MPNQVGSYRERGKVIKEDGFAGKPTPEIQRNKNGLVWVEQFLGSYGIKAPRETEANISALSIGNLAGNRVGR